MSAPSDSGDRPAIGASVTAAIVGRPNVGKSTLFNRLVGRRQAIVHNQPGVTRDRIVGGLTLDDGRPVTLIDTGGLLPGDDPMGLNEQVMMAVEESDLLLLVVDGKEGLVASDEAVWDELRRSGKPALMVVNKSDVSGVTEGAGEFYRLGLDELLAVSAEHGRGIDDLRQAMARHLPAVPVVASASDATPVAIVGRPNVGKSSLLNRIVGARRSLVSDIAGTTRDPVDTLVERPEGDLLLIDTAGIRRRGGRGPDVPESLAVMMAKRQIERAQLAVLVIDAAQGVTTGDLSIAGAVWEMGRAAVVAINKWDLLTPDQRHDLEEGWPRLSGLLSEPRRVNLSALTGRGLDKLFPAIDATLDSFNTKLATADVNRLFEIAAARHRPPAGPGGRPWKLYYATQVATAPPTFMLFANRSLSRSDSYRRYLENQLREALQLPGVPVRLVIRKR